jgi:hypothetical protein
MMMSRARARVRGGETTSRQGNGRPRLAVRVDIWSDAEAEEVAEATLELRRELLQLDVERVKLARAGEPPPGTSAVDLVALGALVVTVAQSGLFGAVVGVIQFWLAGHPQRSVKVEGDVLELTEVSSKEQRRLADELLRRHTGR